MDVLSQDLRVALRRIQRAPALATAIVLTIGLGLGAAAAIFMTSDAALVEPLPYAEPQRLVHLWEVRAGTAERSPTSYPTLLDWRSRAKSFSGLEAYDPTNITVGMGDEARMLRGARVTAGFFRLLGVRISAGRDFLDEDATTGAAVAIVSDRFARSVAGGIALDQTVVIIRRFPMMLCGVFAAAALALTLVALYAICMHEVLTRRREFGIRLALGGSPGSIRRLILNDAMLLGATGIGVGGIVATVVSRSLRAVLFGITATDWRVYGVVAAGVLVFAVLATLGPALRAGSVHPSVVMRVD